MSTERPAIWTRPRPDRRGRSTDLAIALGLFISGILSQQLYRVAGVSEDPADGLTTFLVLAGLTVPLAWRRVHPVPVAGVVAVMFGLAGELLVPEFLITNIALFAAIYAVGAWESRRSVANWTRTAIVVAMAIWLVVTLFRVATDADETETAGVFSPLVAYLLLNLIINTLYFGGAWWFGERAFASARQRHELERRTRELEEARELAAKQAVDLDRVRIARELHDVVAHHVSVIGIQAGAARTVLTSNPEAASTALQAIESTTRETIRELQTMLSTLRHSDDAGEAPRGIERVEELVASSRESGIPTTFTVVGDPAAVPQVASVSLYRVAQEALTNVRKHAGPHATADVRVRYGAGHVELEVANTGGVASARRPGGLGQLGMRERVSASGGSLEVGPRSRGGYVVRARIPLPEATT